MNEDNLNEYTLVARNRRTDQEETVIAIKGLYGLDQFGYQTSFDLLNEAEFHKMYDPVIKLTP